MSPPDRPGTRSLLVLSPTPGRGGAEEYLLTVAHAAHAQGWRVTVGLEPSSDTRSLVKELNEDPQIAYVGGRLRIDHRGGALRQAVVSAGVILRARPDAVLIVLPWPTLGVGCMVATALTATPSAAVFQLAPWFESIGRWGSPCRWAHRRGQLWISVSDASAGVVARIFGVTRSEIRVIYNGTRPADPARASARADLRTELKLPATARVILTVGRLSLQKGYEDLLGVVPDVLDEHPDVVFVWAGEGSMRAELESAVVRGGLSGRVLLLGHRTDVPALLDGADLFVLPSRFEGLPFALLEAMARGVPVLTSDAGGSSEVVRPGADGLIYPEGNRSELSDRLRWALHHPEEMTAMGHSARSRAAEFSEDHMLSETLSALETRMTRGRTR